MGNAFSSAAFQCALGKMKCTCNATKDFTNKIAMNEYDGTAAVPLSAGSWNRDESAEPRRFLPHVRRPGGLSSALAYAGSTSLKSSRRVVAVLRIVELFQ